MIISEIKHKTTFLSAWLSLFESVLIFFPLKFWFLKNLIPLTIIFYHQKFSIRIQCKCKWWSDDSWDDWNYWALILKEGKYQFIQRNLFISFDKMEIQQFYNTKIHVFSPFFYYYFFKSWQRRWCTKHDANETYALGGMFGGGLSGILKM